MLNPPPWSEAELAIAVDHGLQREGFVRVRDRLKALRTARSWRDLHEIQGTLLEDVLWVQEYKSRVKRNRVRTRKGKQTADPESGSWDLEERIAARVEKQIRSVGDCLAWRVLGCRRQVFWILSQNANPGSVYGKAGLGAEAQRVDQHWAEGHFALMNDLTQSVRIGDLIVFTNVGPKLDEVKTDAARRRSEQRQRIRRALDTLNRKAPLAVAGEPHEIFEARTQLKTRLGHLQTALRVSKDSGLGAAIIRQGWAVMALTLLAKNPKQNAGLEELRRFQEDMQQKGGLASGLHMLQSMWSWLVWDLPDPMMGSVPFGAYPIDPELCAELTCGYSMFRTFISADLVDSALRSHGFETSWKLAEAHDQINATNEILTVARRAADGMRGIGLRGNALNQILYELVEPDRYAQALREMFDWSLRRFPRQAQIPDQTRRQLGHATFAFANERAVWFRKASG